MAQGLAVRVFNTIEQSSTDYSFRRLPIRIGRNQLNDLVLDFPFVSQFHAVLEPGGRGLLLRDLGSTNGTTLRATGRLPANQVADLAEHQYEFAIVSLILRVWSIAVPDGPQKAHSARRPLAVSSLFAAVPSPAGAAAVGQSAQQISALGLAGHYASYRTAWLQFLRVFSTGLEALPPASRPALIQQVARDFPAAALEPEFKTLAAQHGGTTDQSSWSADTVASQGLRELATDFVPELPPPTSPQETAAFAARIQSTLDVFIRSFVPLRDGYRQFESEMAIRTSAPGYGEIKRVSVRVARDAKELARLLLDWRDGSSDCFAEVEAVFADLMIHHVAMLAGVTRGVRSLLAELSPEEIERALQDGRSKVGGIQVGPLKYKSLWRAFQERYADVAEDEKQIHSLLFGAQFARAYGESRGGGDERTRVQTWPPRGGS